MTEPVVSRGDRTPQDIPDITLVQFLTARLDEDERIARTAGDTGWEPTQLDDPDAVLVLNAQKGIWSHIYRHDPARVLRDVEAKRRIIDEHEQAGSDLYVGEPMPWCVTCSSGGWPCPTLRLLALSYADHPDYRAEEWAP